MIVRRVATIELRGANFSRRYATNRTSTLDRGLKAPTTIKSRYAKQFKDRSSQSQILVRQAGRLEDEAQLFE